MSRSAATAQEAMDQVDRQVPDAAVIDLGLPDEGGIALIRRIRERHAMPIVVATGSDTRELVGEFENDTSICVLAKPFDVPQLLACLSSLNVLPQLADDLH